MDKRSNNLAGVLYWVLTAAAFAGAGAMLVFYTPEESTMGPIQKIFYLHLPVAICTAVACTVSFVGCIGYLTSRKSAWDDLASAAARVAVQLCAVVLVTGMCWGRGAWGMWWTWSPRLTFSLLLLLLYVVYLMIRMSVESRQRRAVISAVYGVIAFLDVPLVYLSTKLMPDIHPTSIELAPAMKATLGVWFAPVVLMSVGLLVMRFKLNRAGTRRAAEATTAFPVVPAATAPLRWTSGGVS